MKFLELRIPPPVQHRLWSVAGFFVPMHLGMLITLLGWAAYLGKVRRWV